MGSPWPIGVGARGAVVEHAVDAHRRSVTVLTVSEGARPVRCIECKTETIGDIIFAYGFDRFGTRRIWRNCWPCAEKRLANGWPKEPPPYEQTCRACGRTMRGWGQWAPAPRSVQIACDYRCANQLRTIASRHPRTVRILTCPQCGQPFTATSRDAEFCSAACQVAAHRAPHTTRSRPEPPA